MTAPDRLRLDAALLEARRRKAALGLWGGRGRTYRRKSAS
jgi:hypothetical protein